MKNEESKKKALINLLMSIKHAEDEELAEGLKNNGITEAMIKTQALKIKNLVDTKITDYHKELSSSRIEITDRILAIAKKLFGKETIHPEDLANMGLQPRFVAAFRNLGKLSPKDAKSMGTDIELLKELEKRLKNR